MQKEEKVSRCFDFDSSSPKTLPAAVKRSRLLSYLHLLVIGMYLCHLQIGITVKKFNLIGGRDFHVALTEALAAPFVGLLSRVHPLRGAKRAVLLRASLVSPSTPLAMLALPATTFHIPLGV